MRRSRRARAMFVVAGCFAISAIARLTDPTFATAMAADTDDEVAQSPAAVDTATAETALMAELMARAQTLDARAAALNARENAVEAAAAAAQEQIAALEALEIRLAKLVDIASTAAEDDVQKLVATYQAMDGKKAAAIVETMDVDFAAGLLARMRGEAAAAIFAALPPDVAYAITARIAGRNAADHSN